EAIVGNEWLTEQLEPILQSVPMELRAKVEPAELYHEMLEHRWFMSEQAAAEISMKEAAQSYVNTVLRGLPDEKGAVDGMDSGRPLANPFDPSQGFADEEGDTPYDPWEDEAEFSTEDKSAYFDIAALRAKPRITEVDQSYLLPEAARSTACAAFEYRLGHRSTILHPIRKDEQYS